MLTKLFAFEAGYHFRQTAWWLAAAAFLGLGVLTVRGNFGGDEVYRNSPYAITVVISLLSLCTIFAATVFSAGTLLRDKTYRMEGLVFTTPVGRARYYGIKFAGLFVAVFSLLCLAALGAWIGSLLLSPAYRGPSNIRYYLYPLLVFGLPNVLFTCTMLFCLGMRSWNPKIVYAGGVLLYLLYLVTAILSGSPMLAGASGTGQSIASTLSDPFGLGPFFGGTRYWTAEQRNTTLFPLSGWLLLNRVLWTVSGAILLWLAYRKFKLSAGAGTAVKIAIPDPEIRSAEPYATAYTQTTGFDYMGAAFAARVRLEVRAVCLHVPFLLMMALWAFYTSVELVDSLTGLYGIKTIAGSGQIAQHLLAVRPAILLIIFYAAELAFAEREHQLQAIIDSSPLPSALLWAGKSAALAVMAAVIVTVNLLIGITVQVAHLQFPIRWDVYASLYWYAALPLALHGILALFLLTVVRRKFAGMVVCLIMILPVLFGSRFGTEHPMLRFALPPQFKWSDMSGFGRGAMAFGWYMVYWGAMAAVMGVLTVKAWRQGWKGWWKGWNAPGRISLLISMVVCITAGSYIFHEMHISGGYQSEAAKERWMAEYEKTLKPTAHAHLPVITTIRTHIRLFPQTGRYTVDGEYILQNQSTVPLDTLQVGISPDIQVYNIIIANTRDAGQNHRLRMRWFRLVAPLLPGDSVALQFHLEAERSGFVPFNSEHSVAINGSYIEIDKHLPYLGYNASFELDDRHGRVRNGLPENAASMPADSLYHRIRYITTVSTDEGQTALAPGNLIRRHTANGATRFDYDTELPAPEGLAISAARYAHRQIRWRDHDVHIYFHPNHTANISALLSGMRDALAYCDSNYAPYPSASLTLAEIPEYPGAATAYPGLLFGKEGILFTSDFRDTARVHHGYAIAAHETAHQWWAHLLEPQADSSYKFLTETMAKHVESRVLEHRFGRALHRQYLDADRHYYLSMRSGGKELPLIRSAGQNWVHYQKGALAMDTLTQIMGESKVNAGMRELMRAHTPPFAKPNAESLMRIWEREADAGEREMLERWFRRVEIIY